MAQDFAKQFYRSKRWQNCREAYAKSVGYLCEKCLASGIYTPGEIVHHKIKLTPDNIENPDIALSFNNLELLCRKCHGNEHTDRRYYFDENGNVVE